MNWGYLIGFVIMLAVAFGYAWFIRQEGRTGRAYILFWPVERWSRDRQPVLFQMRQFLGWIFVVFFAAVALSFLAQFLGLVHA
jgi:hypothetical protein